MNSRNFVLVCKSYIGDLRRMERLLNSIQKFNADNIPVYIIVPQADLDAFKLQIQQTNPDGTSHNWLTDEDIIAAHPQAHSHNLLDRYRKTAGSISQQIIKSEAWRSVACDAYLSLDSDSIFLKSFHIADFVLPDGTPYTVMHQAKDMYQLVLNKNHPKQYAHFLNTAHTTQKHFGRQGPTYSFSPQPYLWARQVWHDLHEKWLLPKNLTFWDALEISPFEAHWYGEALLHFQSIPLIPIEPILRVYHFDWQYDLYKKHGERAELLTQQYLGVCLQSNWEVEMDIKGKRTLASRLVRTIKRFLKSF